MRQMSSIKENILHIQNLIQEKKKSLGISYPITIIGVTKTLPLDIIQETVKAGITDIGESRIQEAEKKFSALSSLSFTKHMIGHLQENKVNKAAALFDVIQSIENLDCARKLNRKLSEMNKIMPILIEVNTSGEKSKAGISPEETVDFCGALLELPQLKVSGLMTIGPLDKPLEETRKAFSLLYQLRGKIQASYPNYSFPLLSMGMSDDFEIAIEEGANMLRLGRILFGKRIE